VITAEGFDCTADEVDEIQDQAPLRVYNGAGGDYDVTTQGAGSAVGTVICRR
jgi:hypothetical protein